MKPGALLLSLGPLAAAIACGSTTAGGAADGASPLGDANAAGRDSAAAAADAVVVAADGARAPDGPPVGPTAVISASTVRGEAPLAVAFSAAESIAGGSALASYAWDFGDGSAGASGASVAHTYLPAGRFTASLVATDQAGLTDRAEVSINVAPESCPRFASPVQIGRVASGQVSEASGLVASARNEGILWVHNDSGDGARLYALASDGALRATYRLTGASAFDWEDMALGPGPDPETAYLYLADMGDNDRVRGSVVVYRVPEPEVPLDGSGDEIDLDGTVALTMMYPDEPHDAEALLLDPVTADLFIATKTFTGQPQLFRYPAPHREDERVTLELVRSVEMGGSPLFGNGLVTAGDVTPLGNQVILRTYTEVLVWIRRGGEPLASAFEAEPCPAVLPLQPQGETIGYSVDGRGYYTLSEWADQPIYFIGRSTE